MAKQVIKIFVNGSKQQKNGKDVNLIDVFENRLRSQDRAGNNSGTLYFSPTILCTLLNNYDAACSNEGSFITWINNTLKSVYFELQTGEIIPLSAVSELHLESSTQQVANNSVSLQNIQLSSLQLVNIPTPSAQTQNNNMYEVYICRVGSNKQERVYLGDKLNLAKNGTMDLTLDHVVTTYDMREQYQNDLEYIAKIDALIRFFIPQHPKMKSRKLYNAIATDIANIISFNDQTALNKLNDELALIVRATRGIRVCTARVNKLSF